MDTQDRYDELDNFLNTLDLLKDDLKSKDLKDEIDYLLYEAGYDEEKEELEKELNETAEQEERELSREFDEMRL